ncbi:MAG: acetyltransferase [Candidatus Berkelbacteria bacterium]|nr:acetyltransferase [Candidatus Berkelbacteria bacterium]
MKILTTFVSKSGKEYTVIEPKIELLDEVLDFVNDLVAEDTFLSFTGRPIEIKDEKIWLENVLKEIGEKKQELIWVTDGEKIVGSCDVRRGGTRDYHVGTVGIMVRKDYRNDGIGRFMFEYILDRSQKMNLEIVRLHIFDNNELAKKIYEKYGFREFSRLPNGFYRKGKFSDALQMYKNI